MRSILNSGNVRLAECQADDDEKEKQAEREVKEWNGTGRPPWEQRFPECWRISGETNEEYMSYARETPADTYWRAGYVRTAAFCLIPPTAGYLVILAAVETARWVIRGFAPRFGGS
jgi:hypothetical protein